MKNKNIDKIKYYVKYIINGEMVTLVKKLGMNDNPSKEFEQAISFTSERPRIRHARSLYSNSFIAERHPIKKDTKSMFHGFE